MDDFENGIDDIKAFEKKLKVQKGTILESSDSSSEEELDSVPLSVHSNENVRLQTKIKLLIQQIIDKDKEIDSLRNVLGYAKPETDENEFSGDFKEQKLMELAKKVRTLQVALESEKNRAAHAMEEVNRLREESIKKENTKGWSRNTVRTEIKEPAVNFEKNFQELQVKYNKIKADLKKAKVVIKKEVGDFDNLENLLKNESWKGRAQQIELLKSKINDLKRQVGKRMEETAQSLNTGASVKVEGSADERRKEIQSLQEALLKTREELETFKKRSQGYSSRLVALEKENKEIRETHKLQIKTLLDKTENDDRFISELKNELEKVKKAKGYTRLEPVNNNKEISELRWQIANLHQKLNAVQEELSEKNKLIEMFKNYAEPEGMEEVDLKNKVQELEGEIKKMRDNEKKANSSEDGRIIKDLSSQNARLRSKVNELTEELSRMRGK
jgi:chromosome segregation ATPase